MAFTRVEPVEVHVRTDWFDGTPHARSVGVTSVCRSSPSRRFVRKRPPIRDHQDPEPCSWSTRRGRACP